MKIENLVTSLWLSEMLFKAGIKIHSTFGYYKNVNGEVYIDFIDPEKDIITSAYTSEELLHILPTDIVITSKYYVYQPLTDNPQRKEYKKFVSDREDGYAAAELQNLKTHNTEPSFVSRYWYDGTISTSINQKGEYVNLICFGETEAESRGKMILLLKSENVI